MKLKPTGLGLAFGVAGVFFYLGCVLLMTFMGSQAVVKAIQENACTNQRGDGKVFVSNIETTVRIETGSYEEL